MNLPRFGVTKPVPVNLLMIALIVSGIYCTAIITREFFPDITPQMATVTLPYPGATPEEVESGMALKVEEVIDDLDEVEEIRTSLSEGGGGLTVELKSGTDIDKAVDEIERSIDTLTDLPDESENIQVVALEPRMPVIMVTLYGDASEEESKRAIEHVRDELKTLPDMGEILLSGVRNYEVRVDVSYGAILEHGISLPQIAAAIRAWMAEVPGGSVRTEAGNISVRTLGVPEQADAIRKIVIKASPDGQSLRVGDIATVTEDFVDVQIGRRFNGKPAASLTVFKVGDQDAVEMAKMVRAYVDGRNNAPFEATEIERRLNTKRKQAYDLGANSTMPLPGDLATHSDLARLIEGRLDLLTRNAFWGAVLVFVVLLIFLNWRLAFWVGIGLTTALCGTLLMMEIFGVTLNLLTMFGLIVVMGLLVDDAIVVAENIQTRHDRGEPALQAAINGAQQVFWPVVATVSTSIVAFMPLGMVEGQIGDMLNALPMVVACALIMSLIESVLILPSHMGHSLHARDKKRGKKIKQKGLFERFEEKRDSIINDRIVPAFGKLLDISLRFRYVSIAIALGTLIASFGLIAGGRVAFTFLGDSDSETLVVDVRMPIGTPIEQTENVVAAIETATLQLNDPQFADENNAGNPEIKSVGTILGERQNIETGNSDASATHIAQIFIELVAIEDRLRDSPTITAAIRKLTEGKVDAAESVKYSAIAGGPGGADITFEIIGDSLASIDDASRDVQHLLNTIPGVFDVSDDNYPGQRELQISLKPAAAALGFNVNDIATQVRGALFGIDAHVFSDRREDIDVRVRLDEATRQNLFAIENLWLISPVGNPVPLVEIADLEEGSSYSMIRRIDRQRAVTITADCAPGTNPEDVMRQLNSDITNEAGEIIGPPPLKTLRDKHPNVQIRTGGRQQNLSDAFSSLPLGFAAALLMIYVILAFLFSSYIQPIAVMLAIPFGMIGVIWGHFILGFEMTFLSLIGFVALSGIVVNDSLILVEYYNEQRRDGMAVRPALVDAGKRRLRPIFLTTITTVSGLTPLMLETSFQARFLIPMAIAISFGLISATVLILMVLPCIIVVFDDLQKLAYFLWHGEKRAGGRVNGEW